MDKSFDVEAFRAELRALPRAVVVEAAKKAELPMSTVDKFRYGKITDTRATVVLKLRQALTELAA
jgi:hypothetical protein